MDHSFWASFSVSVSSDAIDKASPTETECIAHKLY